MTEGITMVFRFVARHGDNLANLFCIKLGYGSGAWGFLEAFQHRKIIATLNPVLIPIPPSKYELRSHFGQLDLRWNSSQ